MNSFVVIYPPERPADAIVGVHVPGADGVACLLCAPFMPDAHRAEGIAASEDPMWRLLVCRVCGFSLGHCADRCVP